MHSSENVNIAARAYNAMFLRMRNLTSDTCAQLYWITGTSPTYSESKTQPFTIVPYDPGFSDYRIDLGSHPEWKGLVTQIRLDPVCSVSEGTVELDRLEIYNDPSIGISNAREAQQIRIWPNPASEHIFISLNGVANAFISLTDLSGRIVFEKECRLSRDPYQVNTGMLDKGIYLLRIFQESMNHVSTIIIQ
jgi:hypothetical protein